MTRSAAHLHFRFLGLLLGLGVIGALACTRGSVANGPAGSASPAAGWPVLAAFYPLYEVVRRVGGERVSASNLVASGGEPHDFEMTPRDLDRLRAARLLVYVGAGFQPGLERAIASTASPTLRSLDVLAGLPLLSGQAEGAAEAPTDPHVWLDPILMKAITERVRDTLIEIDPAGRPRYEANTAAYLADLTALDTEFRAGLAQCRRHEIVTSHAAFGYLAQRYGLTQRAVTGLSPESEPSPQQLQAVVQFAKERGVKVIYFETLVDPRVAQTIARETGAETRVLNPIEGLTPTEQAAGRDYAALMRENLAALRAGLECS